MTIAQADEVIAWATTKKDKAAEYETRIICVGQ
jgi:hypothetical protein